MQNNGSLYIFKRCVLVCLVLFRTFFLHNACVSYQNKLHPSNLSPVLAKASLLLEQLQDNKENTDSVQVIHYLKVMKWGISAVQF